MLTLDNEKNIRVKRSGKPTILAYFTTIPILPFITPSGLNFHLCFLIIHEVTWVKVSETFWAAIFCHANRLMSCPF